MSNLRFRLLLVFIGFFPIMSLAQEESMGGPEAFMVSEDVKEAPRMHYQGQYEGQVKLFENLTSFVKFSHFHGTPYPYVKQSNFWFAGYDIQPGLTFDLGDFYGIRLGLDTEIFYRFQERHNISGGRDSMNIFPGSVPGTLDSSVIKSSCGTPELFGADTTWAFDCDDYKEYRPTVTFSISFPIASWLSVEYRNRVERRIITSPRRSVAKMYRPLFRISTGEFSSLMGLQLYAYYEGFVIEQASFRYEVESGINFRPVSSIQAGLGYRMRNDPTDNRAQWTSRLAALYVTYFFDASGWISK